MGKKYPFKKNDNDLRNQLLVFMGLFPSSLKLMGVQSLVQQALLDLVLDWVRLVFALDKDVQVKCGINYKQICSLNQTYIAIAGCILNEKVTNQYLSDIYIYIYFFPQ